MKIPRIIGVITIQGLLMSAPPAVLAATPIVPNVLQRTTNVLDVVRGIVSFIILVAFVAAFIFLLVGGVRWITAGGDEKAIASARSTITAAIVGLVIVLLAFAIIRVVEIFFVTNIISTGVNIPTVNDSN